MDDEETEALHSSIGTGGLRNVILEKSRDALFKEKLICLFDLLWHRFLQPELLVDSQNQNWVTVHETDHKTISCHVKLSENDVNDYKCNIRTLPNS